MGERLRLVATQQCDIAGFSLLLQQAQAAVSVIEQVLAPDVADRPNWTLPRLQDEIERRTGERISKSRLSVVLKKGGSSGDDPDTR
jgi:hypothetical protein